LGHEDGPATQQEYDDKVAGLAQVINAVGPDVLALQEVGPEQVLADLNAACSIDLDNRPVGIPDGRGIRVALSPRLEVTVAGSAIQCSKTPASEHGAATTLAALTSGAYKPASSERIAVVVCGANTDFAR
jgi:hypothetical protein